MLQRHDRDTKVYPGVGIESPDQVTELISRLRELSHCIPMWPDPVETRRSANKWEIINELDEIAKTYTKTARPSSKLYDSSVPLVCDGSKVYKREGSAYGDFVLHGKNLAIEKLSNHLCKPANGYRWIVQDYIPQLQWWGEYRIYIVAGMPLSIVGTRPRSSGGIDVMRVTHLYNLQELRHVIVTPTNLHY
jgi:glutathione synthase/RimK-type ligase-like ATP-grasp enzyme